MEATTGWRFVVQELQAIGAHVHLAEPAETAARRGQEAPQDRSGRRQASARAVDGRPAAGVVDCARAHPRSARTRAVAPHAGRPARRVAAADTRGALPPRLSAPPRCWSDPAKGRAWLDSLGLPQAAREQVTVALVMIDMLDVQLAPIDKELRAYARRQPGCRALMAHYGIGHLTAVTILAELGDARRFSSSREAVRYAGLDITVKQSDQRRAPGPLSRQGPPALRWALYEAAHEPAATAAPTATTTTRRPSASAVTAPASRSPGPCSSAATTPCASSVTRRCNPREIGLARAAPSHTDAPRPAPGIVLPPRPRGRPPTTERLQSSSQRDHPI